MSQSGESFGKIRQLLWPVHNYELKKVVPMLLLMFFINFNYTVLRDTKDALVVTAPGSGAEAIPFLKVWCVLPSAIFAMIIFSKLSNILSKPRLFTLTVAPFLIFFALFATVLYPNKEVLHPHAFCDYLQTILPKTGASVGVIAIIRNWTYSCFYILAELWGSMVLSLLFWGFANDITRVSEAKRFYTLFAIGANIAMTISGPLIVYFSRVRDQLPAGVDPWGYSLNYLMGMVVFNGLATLYLYNWINKSVLTDARFYDPNEVKKKKKSKPKMSMLESFAYLTKSKYIACIAMLVISYGIAINLVEVSWKSQLKLLYPNANDYSAYMGYLSQWTGWTTLFLLIFVGGNSMRLLGWRFTAMITPIVLLLTSLMFYGFVVFKDLSMVVGMLSYLATTPLVAAVTIGLFQNVISKASKYSFFDPTKEMAYIPLDEESKVKGKAAIDVVGARLGKSGGSLIQQFLLLFMTIQQIVPYVAVIIVFIIGGWVFAIRSLNNQIGASEEKAKDDVKKAGEEATLVTE